MSDFTITSTPTNASTSGAGRTLVNRVLLDNQVLDVRPRNMSMQRSPNKHDAVTLAVSSSTLTDTEGIANHLISFVYGRPPRTEYWYGYVIQVSEEQRDNVNIHFTLSLLGVTLPMQLGKTRFWTNKSIPAVVHDLVNANLLGVSGSDHPHHWKALAQTAESDWQIATILAARIGYGLFHWNGVVICEDPLVLYNSNGSYIRLVPDSDIDPTGTQLLEFVPVQDSERTYTGMGVKLAYLTNDGKVGWALQPNFEHHRFTRDIPIRSQDEADVYIAAVAKRTEGWLQVAKARIKGDATIFPGINVEIVTATRTRDKRFDGKWLVIGASHKMDDKDYQTELALARPGITTPSQVMPYRPFWEAGSRGKPSLVVFGEREERQWASTWADSRLRSIT